MSPRPHGHVHAQGWVYNHGSSVGSVSLGAIHETVQEWESKLALLQSRGGELVCG
jgi:hypothetical protein